MDSSSSTCNHLAFGFFGKIGPHLSGEILKLSDTFTVEHALCTRFPSDNFCYGKMVDLLPERSPRYHTFCRAISCSQFLKHLSAHSLFSPIQPLLSSAFSTPFKKKALQRGRRLSSTEKRLSTSQPATLSPDFSLFLTRPLLAHK